MLSLHNWGEPLLNTHFKDILRVIKDLKLYVAFSTNASTFVDLSDEILLENCKTIVISCSGSSQASYSRAHGFDYEKIKNNILKLREIFLASGYSETINLTILLFKYNVHEIQSLIDYANANGMSYNIVPASFNSQHTTLDYLAGTLSVEIFEKAQSELFLPTKDFFKRYNPDKYHCSQHDYLTLTHAGMLSLCCAARLDQSEQMRIASITSLSLEQIRQIKSNHPFCKECLDLGIAAFVHTYYDFAQELTGLNFWQQQRSVGVVPFFKRLVRKLVK